MSASHEQQLLFDDFIGVEYGAANFVVKILARQRATLLLGGSPESLKMLCICEPWLDLLNRVIRYIGLWKQRNGREYYHDEEMDGPATVRYRKFSMLGTMRRNISLRNAIEYARTPLDSMIYTNDSGMRSSADDVRQGIINFLRVLHEAIRFWESPITNTEDAIREITSREFFRDCEAPFLDYFINETYCIGTHFVSFGHLIEIWKTVLREWTEYLAFFDSVYPRVLFEPREVLKDILISYPHEFWSEFWWSLINVPVNEMHFRSHFHVYLTDVLAAPAITSSDDMRRICQDVLQTVVQYYENQRDVNGPTSYYDDVVYHLTSRKSFSFALRVLDIVLMPHPSKLTDDSRQSFEDLQVSSSFSDSTRRNRGRKRSLKQMKKSTSNIVFFGDPTPSSSPFIPSSWV